ncbi:hypothetical protein SAMN05444678_102123 [Sphingomonas sp. YR710]|uniref:hypothetical protein n=1 Tax=Sphingomonas sp. YR710 TaxID=1882773 RepID=UPI00087F92DF|nr:hypothetical protein [Sphingomonas sp. YR710]SDC26299.1 hypothetical protein SAMN05444678_102123 [Sphingomonas sp. YR710]
MMMAAGLLPPIGVMLLRLGWGGRRAIIGAGWIAILAGIGLLGRANGAWGIAIGSVLAMAAAAALLGWAAWTTPVRPARTERASRMVVVGPRRRFAGRLATFVIVGPAGFAAAQILALGLHAAARGAGQAEADATALALLLQPAIWAVLMTVQLLCARRRTMITVAAVTAAAGGLLWGLA